MSRPAACARRDVPASGPLTGIRVLEFGGIGPGPFGAMILSDLGADVLRLDRPAASGPTGGYDRGRDVLLRGRRSLLVDLKPPQGRDLALRLVEAADVLIDPFRPGVVERLGLGPAVALERNSRLVFVRVTGWGQEGPWANLPGHDINYLALSGALSLLGRADSPPPPPLNLVADYGGGGMLVVVATCAALVERATSGLGQVVDVAMVDGVALQYAMVLGRLQSGAWEARRESNDLDGGAPFYDTYETADGRYVAVGALEPKFYAELLRLLDLNLAEWPQWDRERWPELREALRTRFASHDQAHWEKLFDRTEACVAPVLEPLEAAHHPQNAARGVFTEVDGLVQPAPAPRFTRTPGRIASPPHGPGEGGLEALEDWGVGVDEARTLAAAGVIR
jgi:alpha-methylacyl-CoA racemase